MSADSNATLALRKHAKEHPDKPALIVPTGNVTAPWESISYQELNRRVDCYARGFAAQGIRKGQRVLFLIKPGIEFFASLFGFLRLGAVPVLVDPGMGLRAVLKCIEQIKPNAICALPLVHVVRLVRRRPFASCEVFITAGTRWLWGGATLQQCLSDDDSLFETEEPTTPSDEALIAFTSGSTGPAKGVVYTHGMIGVQSRLIGQQYGLTPDVTTVECFAAFLIFDLLMGMTVVKPDMDMSKPAQADPAKVIQAIVEHKATLAFGSPVVWANVTRYAQENDLTLPSLEKVLTAGAPIPADMHRRFQEILSDGVQLFTPYGATESLPVASIGTQQILDQTWERTAQGHGTCVGPLYPEVEVRIMQITESPCPHWSDSLRVPDGEIGEIVVKGQMVSPAYKFRPDANAAAKIRDTDGQIMHRMGDIGYLDEQGLLWFCGRKAHRLLPPDTMVPAVPVEGVFNEHSNVLRTALVGVGEPGAQKPVLCVELEKGAEWSEAMQVELIALAEGTQWKGLVDTFLPHPGFPTDPRHNSKIRREELREWATAQLK